MNTGQTLLTLGAMVLLTTSVVNFNNYIYDQDVTLMQNQYRMEALSILNEEIKKISVCYFDEAMTDVSSIKKLTDFTQPVNLGFDVNDNGKMDDFDDYNDQTRTVTGESGAPYKLLYNIAYVRLYKDQIIKATKRKYYKRLSVSIVDDYAPPLIYKYASDGSKIRDTLRVSVVKSLWYYN